MVRASAFLAILVGCVGVFPSPALCNPGLGTAVGFQVSLQDTPRHSAFRVPAAMRGRVDFWKDVFAKYGKHQVVIHHREFPQVVFGVLDFSAEAATMDPVSLDRHMDRVEKQTVLSMKEQIKELVGGAEPATAFQKNFVEKMEGVPAPSRSYKRLLDEDLLRTQTGIRERYAQAVSRAWRYLPAMEHIFTSDYGLPKELTRLPFIESSFDYTAYSSVGAAGIWQFMPRTARSHRMLVGRYVDERRDPIKATRGAAEYLRLAYQELGSWPLAITSYNHGVGGVRSKVRQAGTSQIAELIEHPSERYFGFASTNFYPEFLAAVEIFEEHEKYFPEVAVQPPLRLVSYTVKSPMSGAQAAKQVGVGVESLREANYALLDPIWRGSARIPAGYVLQVPVERQGRSEKLETPEPVRSRIVTTDPGSEGKMYRVTRGDTLERIAERYNTTPSELVQLNRLSSRRVEPGQVMYVPKGAVGAPSFEVEPNRPEVPAVALPAAPIREARPSKQSSHKIARVESAPKRYTVRKGDTLFSIATKSKCSVADLKRLNGIKGNTIEAGRSLKLP